MRRTLVAAGFALMTGRAAHITMRERGAFRSDGASLARAIWVNTDGEGTVWDPCKEIR